MLLGCLLASTEQGVATLRRLRDEAPAVLLDNLKARDECSKLFRFGEASSKGLVLLCCVICTLQFSLKLLLGNYWEKYTTCKHDDGEGEVTMAEHRIPLPQRGPCYGGNLSILGTFWPNFDDSR